jgi:Sulfotransferase family
VNKLPHLRGLTSSYAKDTDAELRIAEINDLLAPVERDIERKHTAPAQPTVFVLGPPRSGTTLLSQLLAATGGFGVATNFVARFWRAPALGMLIERALGDRPSKSDFQSVRGVTHSMSDPHEFGYFWSSWFDISQDTHALSKPVLEKVDAVGMKRAVSAMECVAGKPMMYKNNTWFTFQADWLARHFPQAVIVACCRDPFYIAQSIYEQRKRLYDDVAKWWSVRPPSYEKLLALTPLEQVAAQAVEIARHVDGLHHTLPAKNVVRVDYSRLCSAPKAVISDVIRACENFGEISAPAMHELPQQFDTTDTIRLSSRDSDLLQKYIFQHTNRP